MDASELTRVLDLEGELPHLEQALTHPSFSNEQRARVADNQRLEFLGDSVLGLCVSELLMMRFPNSDEGELSLMRSSLVNTEALAAWARSVGLGSALRLGRGADAAGERDQKNVLGDAVEALVAAVYLDRGIIAARRLSDVIVAEALARLAQGAWMGRDSKSELQERIQAGGGDSPRYRVVETVGPDHRREFVVAVESLGEFIGEGRGRSKKLAEQAAARNALERRAASASTSSADVLSSAGPTAKAHGEGEDP